MARKFTISFLALSLCFLSYGQKKDPASDNTELTFYADRQLEQAVSSIGDGVMNVYVKAFHTKEMRALKEDQARVELSIRWKGQREVYEDVKHLSQELDVRNGYEVFEIRFNDEKKASLFFDQVEQSDNDKIRLDAQLLGGRSRSTVLAEGDLTLDLSNGKDQYIEYILSKNVDFTFDGTDGFKDDELKVRVIADFERRWKIKVHQFAWGERVPYTGDDSNYYRRQTAGMTYRETDGACYKSGVSVFDVSSDPEILGYQYENDGTRFNPERIPCERVKM